MEDFGDRQILILCFAHKGVWGWVWFLREHFGGIQTIWDLRQYTRASGGRVRLSARFRAFSGLGNGYTPVLLSSFHHRLNMML